MNWLDVSKKKPCPSCGGTSFCTLSADGQFGNCRRVARSSRTGKTKRDKNGAEYVAFRCGGTPQRKGAIYVARKALEMPSDVLNAHYEFILSRLTLAPGHRQQLFERGLSNDAISKNWYRTLPSGHLDRTPVATALVDQFGPAQCASIPGVVMAPFPSLAGRPGILIPVRDVVGRIIALKIRADVALEHGRYSYFSSKAKGGLGPGAQVHIPLHGDHDKDLVRVTEGELKADVATALSGILTLSVPGVGNWRPVLPDLKALNPKTVRIAFDRDVDTNTNVHRAFHQLANALQLAGFNTEIEKWS